MKILNFINPQSVKEVRNKELIWRSGYLNFGDKIRAIIRKPSRPQIFPDVVRNTCNVRVRIWTLTVQHIAAYFNVRAIWAHRFKKQVH
jgi:hypothetical protein